MEKDCAFTTLKNLSDILLCQLALTVEENLITFNANYIACVLINKVLHPTLQDTSSQFLAQMCLKVIGRNLHLFCKVKDLQNVTVVFKTDSTQKGCYRQLLLTVNVSIHYILDVGSKFYPTALERNNTGRIQLSAIAMHTATKKDTGRTMQLAYHNTFGTIYNKGAIVGHVWNWTKEDVFNNCIEILVIRISTVKFQLGLQGYAVSQTTLKALFDRIFWWINIIVQELKNEIVSSISNGEILAENLIQTVVLAKFWGSIQLDEVLKRLQLHIKEIRISIWSLDGSKIYSVVNNIRHLIGLL